MTEGTKETQISRFTQFDRRTLSDQSYARTKVDDFSQASIEFESSFEQRSQLIKVDDPEPDSSSIAARLFYRTENLPITFLGVEFNFDLFLGNLEKNDVLPDGKVRKYQIPILEQVERLQTSANMDKNSMEAFTVWSMLPEIKGK